MLESSDPTPPTAAPLQVTNDAILTVDVVDSLFQAYTTDLRDLHLIPDNKPTRRYQWLFERLLNRTQNLYAECEELRSMIVRNALRDLDKLVEERKRVEDEYVAEIKAKDDLVEGLVKQLQGALGKRFQEADAAKQTVGSEADVVELPTS